jgi:FkbM family methyltransferase
MDDLLKKILSGFLKKSRLELFPVRVRRGVARGASWTLYPWSSYWRGTHEPVVQSFLSALGGPNVQGWSCWDLGAHYGLYSVGLARRVGPSGQVASFEPNPVSFARLARHREMNHLGQLRLWQAAVSDSSREEDMFTYGNFESTTTHLRYEGEVGHGGKPIRIKAVQLDQLVGSGDIREPDFIKVDVEGHGHRALAGARETIARKRPIILIAFHSDPERDGVTDLLLPLGYTIARLAGAEEFVFSPGPAAP